MRDDNTPTAPRFQHPKVMLIDISEADSSQVRDAGYRVSEGSLGSIFVAPPIAKVVPPPESGQLAGFMEQEVIVVQMAAPDSLPLDPKAVPAARKTTEIWASLETGEFDTRPLLARHASSYAERILAHGGVFVIFCAAERDWQLMYSADNLYGGVQHDPLDWSVYDLVPDLAAFGFDFDQGEEIRPLEDIGNFNVLAPFLSDAHFVCTIDPRHREKDFLTLAASKYGKPVAGVLLTKGVERADGTNTHGWVFLLPQVADVGGCVTAMLDTLLPHLVPRIFPESEATVWLGDENYELPEVLHLQSAIAEVQSDAVRRETELRAEIEQAREREGWMHTLLTGTADELVDAVTTALTELGLGDVRKADDEEEDKEQGRRREDIQVWGQSPVLLVEVKGIIGLPREAQALQVTKYLVPRMQQWDRTDVQGLSVINQERGLPGLERENDHVFQQDVLDNATEQKFGLVTALDLFRLVRSKRRWGWAEDTVAPLLYQPGRIHPVPLHYEAIGVINNYFADHGVVAIALTGTVDVGDEISFRLPIDFHQELVESMQVEKAPVEHAEPGQHVAFKTGLTQAQARNGVPVYRLVPWD